MEVEFLLVLFLLATLILHHKSFQPSPANTNRRHRTRQKARRGNLWQRWWREEEWLGPWDYSGSEGERSQGFYD
ncbi:hypothetical protein G4Y79_03185 [Phototrophicus methaneseepsis]|uniref:Uncharacterized protein n=1 Tax=Phototrophicus methaneseepsis TaxID=2710758 RepID=A0A7S8IE85_9CHLR|nr:hypothetical protein [Phototrophicus methaneseepsis]QPC83400.1 hypothetical protein G4Y79_03185 [Phototrophicus methaneseepsis]